MQTLTIRIPGALRDALDERAQKERRRPTELARMLLEAALKPPRSEYRGGLPGGTVMVPTGVASFGPHDTKPNQPLHRSEVQPRMKP